MDDSPIEYPLDSERARSRRSRHSQPPIAHADASSPSVNLSSNISVATAELLLIESPTQVPVPISFTRPEGHPRSRPLRILPSEPLGVGLVPPLASNRAPLSARHRRPPRPLSATQEEPREWPISPRSPNRALTDPGASQKLHSPPPLSPPPLSPPRDAPSPKTATVDSLLNLDGTMPDEILPILLSPISDTNLPGVEEPQEPPPASATVSPTGISPTVIKDIVAYAQYWKNVADDRYRLVMSYSELNKRTEVMNINMDKLQLDYDKLQEELHVRNVKYKRQEAHITTLLEELKRRENIDREREYFSTQHHISERRADRLDHDLARCREDNAQLNDEVAKLKRTVRHAQEAHDRLIRGYAPPSYPRHYEVADSYPTTNPASHPLSQPASPNTAWPTTRHPYGEPRRSARPTVHTQGPEYSAFNDAPYSADYRHPGFSYDEPPPRGDYTGYHHRQHYHHHHTVSPPTPRIRRTHSSGRESSSMPRWDEYQPEGSARTHYRRRVSDTPSHTYEPAERNKLPGEPSTSSNIPHSGTANAPDVLEWIKAYPGLLEQIKKLELASD
ncbi:hypothetical protein H4R33_000442 [Dimargaris cristalligena]|nr:hypothetical protein H4R33_000442 [Dimargaris cristalligena]